MGMFVVNGRGNKSYLASRIQSETTWTIDELIHDKTSRRLIFIFYGST